MSLLPINPDLVDLATIYAQLSLLAFGGGNSILPEMQRQVVDVHHWMTAREFVALYAIAQAAPGPNMLVATLIGWQVAGLSGALVATFAISWPSSLLTLAVSSVWFRFREARWRRLVQTGIVPVTVGLVMAGAALLTYTTSSSVALLGLTAVATVIFLRTNLHPLIVLAVATALGATGLLS
jgi:chromate transporter